MLTIDDDILEQANITAKELKQEIPVLLYQKDKLSFGQAQKHAGLNHYEFQCLLDERKVPLHYNEETLHNRGVL